MEPRDNRFAIPLATLVAGAFVPVTEQVALQPVDDGGLRHADGGGGDGPVAVDGDGD